MFLLRHLTIVSLLISGVSCTGLKKGLTIGTGAAAGGMLANEFGNGDPLLTAAGTLGGAAIGMGINALSDKDNTKAELNGYARGQNDTIKRHYWMLQGWQDQYQAGNGVTNTYDVTVPGGVDAYGVQTVPRMATVRITE